MNIAPPQQTCDCAQFIHTLGLTETEKIAAYAIAGNITRAISAYPVPLVPGSPLPDVAKVLRAGMAIQLKSFSCAAGHPADDIARQCGLDALNPDPDQKQSGRRSPLLPSIRTVYSAFFVMTALVNLVWLHSDFFRGILAGQATIAFVVEMEFVARRRQLVREASK
jgi:hypothetical protein